MAVHLLLLFEPKASDSAHGLFLGQRCFLKTDAKAPTLNLAWTDLMLGVLLVKTLHQRRPNRAHQRRGAPPTGVFQICHT